MSRPPAARRTEVWLRGNLRPTVGVAAVAACLAAVVALAVALTGAPLWTALVAAVVLGAVAVPFAVVAGRPRLARRGDELLVHLSPFVVRRVPLEVVECVFHGSQPLESAATAAAGPPLRVGTLVLRLAERAVEWRERPTFTPWGTWQDGHIICDGRWCEPLTVEVARGVGSRLFEAKRETRPPEPCS